MTSRRRWFRLVLEPPEWWFVGVLILLWAPFDYLLTNQIDWFFGVVWLGGMLAWRIIWDRFQ